VYIGQYTDDTKTIRQMQQQTGLESDDENTTTGIFQAKYQYTPLTEYAATKNDTNTNDYQSKFSFFMSCLIRSITSVNICLKDVYLNRHLY
jgi:hypothetical protein